MMPGYAFAAGLGKLNVNSGLGEPLRAEIELLSLTPDELASLSASVAPEEAYAIQGIPRLSIHNSIKVELSKAADGSPVLKLNSAQPVSDPYLDMLIQVDWSSGRLLREYTILLDPPEYKAAIREASAQPETIINKPASAFNNTPQADSQVNVTAIPDSKSKKSKLPPLKIKPETLPEAERAEAVEVTTQRGDSLAAIARENQIDGVSLEQMLVGLFEANKHAFVDGNMNRLKVGQIIKMPSKDSLLATDRSKASQEVKVHSANWNVYRNSLAANVAAADSAEQNQTSQAASGKITSAEDLAAAKKAGPQDVVKLSAGTKLADKGASTDYDAKVLALQEEATAKEKALKEAQERTTALEAQIANMQKLLALKNQAMANAQKSAEAQKNTAKAPADVKPQQSAPVSIPATVAESEPVKSAELVKPTESAQADVSKSATNAKAADAKKQAANVSKPAPTAEEEFSLLDSIFASIDLLILALAGGVGLLVAGWAYVRNKRRRDLDSFERGILTSGGLSANTVFGNTTGNASTSDTSFLTDFAQSADGTMIDTNDVDPIAEAEVYMAYGRDAQAEEILKDAIIKEPQRYELHLKLLEMYAGRKDISAFEAIAGELYTTLGSDNPTWAKVAELGVIVEPENPLYDLSRLSAMPARAGDTASESANGSVNKDLDWEKELDLDKELEFSSDFSSKPSPVSNESPDSNVSAVSDETSLTTEVVNAGEVVTQFGNVGNVSAELTQDQSMTVSQAAADSVSANQNALNPIKDEEASVLKSVEIDQPPAEDNSLNFDFSELGKFAVDTSATEPKSETVETKAPESNLTNEMEFVPTFILPETADQASEPSAAEDSASKVDDNNSAFNFSFEKVIDEPASALESPAIPSFEAVDFSFNEDEQTETVQEPENIEDSAIVTQSLVMPDFSGINLDLNDETPAENSEPNEIQFELPAVVDTIETKAAVEDPESAAESNFDFSSINLNLSVVPANEAEIDAEALEIAQDEPHEDPGVDIKLDLVKVYIDMDDVEGARDLLDEVLKEGGPNQRRTAEQLLASLS